MPEALELAPQGVEARLSARSVGLQGQLEGGTPLLGVDTSLGQEEQEGLRSMLPVQMEVGACMLQVLQVAGLGRQLDWEAVAWEAWL